MIARLDGRLVEKAPGRLVLDVNGVGYEVDVPLSTFLELPDEGKDVRLRVYTHVREEALQLFGFWSEPERVGFRLLISISGVGPRLALAILSGVPIDRFVRAVHGGDLAALRSIPGVGPKTAQRILVELRDKLDAFEVTDAPRLLDGVDAATVSALVNLGYARAEAEKVVREALSRLPENPELEVLLREALRVQSR
ncbi:MAG: Holliday junction branch migration protein RuvA [Deltaproteobacteria bacterium]|nr:Holliday junction branch migration protein RuvA [Deltaproteobacteria bacterium]MBW2413444.1 Holliday junction branch migration protein RuvA [Deltaproteobacteria bacterium]